jgi:hypothetical protein
MGLFAKTFVCFVKFCTIPIVWLSLDNFVQNVVDSYN